MDMRGAESLHKADIRAILPRMSLLPAKTAPTALINGQRYILYPNTEGHTNTQLKRVGAKHMRVKRIRGIAWGIIAVALVHHLFTAVVLDTSSFWTTLVLPFIYGVTFGVLQALNSTSKTRFQETEGWVQHLGVVTKIERDDIVLNHAYNTLHDPAAGAEKKDKAQAIIDLAATVSIHKGLVNTMDLRIAEAEDEHEVEELHTVHHPQLIEAYQKLRAEYLNARLDYTVPETV